MANEDAPITDAAGRAAQAAAEGGFVPRNRQTPDTSGRVPLQPATLEEEERLRAAAGDRGWNGTVGRPTNVPNAVSQYGADGRLLPSDTANLRPEPLPIPSQASSESSWLSRHNPLKVLRGRNNQTPAAPPT